MIKVSVLTWLKVLLSVFRPQPAAGLRNSVYSPQRGATADCALAAARADFPEQNSSTTAPDDKIRIVRSERARKLSITVKPGGEVRLTIPRGVSEKEALRFLESRREWIGHARLKLSKRQRQQEIISEPYSTKFHTLSLRPEKTDTVTCRVSARLIKVIYPEALPVSDTRVQQTVRKAIEEAWRTEAKHYLPERMSVLASRFGFKYGKITVRNSRTRWGSCSASDNISLSLHLMKLPYELIDYILLHELCHTSHKNHGVKFHALLNKCTEGRHPLLRKELKNYSTRW